MVATRRSRAATKPPVTENESTNEPTADDLELVSGEELSDPEEVEEKKVKYGRKSKKVRAKVPYKRSRVKGRLSRVQDLSIEVLFQIVSNLLPLDLLRLSRTNKWFRSTLLTKSSGLPLWEAAIANLSHPAPEPPVDVSLPAWLSLCYDKSCTFCGKMVKKIDFWLRIRTCPACANENIESTYNCNPLHTMKACLALRTIQVSIPASESYASIGRKGLPGDLVDKGCFQRALDMLSDFEFDPEAASKRAIDREVASWDRTANAINPVAGANSVMSGIHQAPADYEANYLANHEQIRKLVTMRESYKQDYEDNGEMSHFQRCQKWYEDEKNNRASTKAEALQRRKTAILERLKDSGVDVENIPKDAFNHFNQPRDLTDAIWKLIRAPLESHIAFLSRRDQSEELFAYLAQTLLPEFKTSSAYVHGLPEVHPADVMDFPAFARFFQADIGSKPTSEDWAAATATLPDAIATFRSTAYAETLALLPESITSAEDGGSVPALYRPAISFEYVKTSDGLDSQIQSKYYDGGYDFARLGTHRSMRHPDTPENRQLSQACKWMGMENFRFDEENYNVLMKLLEQAGLDNRSLRTEEMSSYKFKWLYKDPQSKRRIAAKWNDIRFGTSRYNVSHILTEGHFITEEEDAQYQRAMQRVRY